MRIFTLGRKGDGLRSLDESVFVEFGPVIITYFVSWGSQYPTRRGLEECSLVFLSSILTSVAAVMIAACLEQTCSHADQQGLLHKGTIGRRCTAAKLTSVCNEGRVGGFL